MIRCLMDALIDEDSKCAHCCVYCNDMSCGFRCELSKQCKTEENVYKADCPDAYDE